MNSLSSTVFNNIGNIQEDIIDAYDSYTLNENFVDISQHFLSDIFLTKSNSDEDILGYDDKEFVQNGNDDDGSDFGSYDADRVFRLSDENEFIYNDENNEIDIMVHSSDELYQCTKCDLEFTGKRALIRHIESHDKKFPIYQCNDCNKVYLSKESLREHSAVHKPVRSFSCEYCGKVLSSEVTLKAHITRHTGLGRFVCSVCGKKFTTKTGLQGHEAIHSENKPFHCLQCDKMFNSKQSFRYHCSVHKKQIANSIASKPKKNDIRAKRQKSTSFVYCSICNKKYISLKSYERHIKSHQ